MENNSRKNEQMEPKQKQHPLVDVTAEGSKVQCCKEQYCTGTWNVRSMKEKVKVKSLSHVCPFATPWTVAYQASPSMEFPRQEYWSGLPFPSPGESSRPRDGTWSPALQANALPSEPP